MENIESKDKLTAHQRLLKSVNCMEILSTWLSIK